MPLTLGSDSTSSKKRRIQAPNSSDSNKPRTSRKKPAESSAAVDGSSSTTRNAPSNVKTLQELSLSNPLQQAISDLELSEFSPLQSQVIPALLGGRDVAAVAQIGRDTMLSFLIPSVALLEKHRFHTRHGTGVLIVTPDRETAVQITGLASELLAGTSHTVGMVIEGANRGAEEQKLDRGVNLLVATPTRLLEHMRDVTSFVFKNMKAFFVYGATSLVEQGMQKQIREIISLIPKKGRTSGVFGNEKVDGVEGLVELICRPDAVHVASMATMATMATGTAADVNASTQTQGYVLVEADKRFLLLHSFLKKFQRERIVVFVSSTPGVLFCEEALGSLDLPVHAIHGRQNSKARAAAFSDFVNGAEGTLICTEEAVQGLDVPPADWVIQYDPPRSIRDFIQRRGTVQGRPVAFVLPSESGFVEILKTAGITVEEFVFHKNKLVNTQNQLEKLVSKNFELHTIAKDGFRSFLQDYNHHPDSKIFSVTALDVRKVGKSFGFSTPPRVEVKTEEKVVVDKHKRIYGPEKPKAGKKRKASVGA